MGLSSEEARQRLKKLILIIEKEAQEAVNEINNEADLEYTLDRKTSVIKPKIMIDLEYEKKLKKKSLQIFNEHNNYLNMRRFEVLKVVDDLYQGIIEDAKNRVITSLQKSDHYEHYKTIFTALICQGLFKLLEPCVIIRVRKKDMHLLKSIIQTAVQEFEKVTHISCKIYLDDENLSEDQFGGLEMFNHSRNIFLDNSLLRRVDIVGEQIKPLLKSKLKQYNKKGR